MPNNDQFIRLSDGCNLFYKLHGTEASKPLLIALHGAPGASNHTESEVSYASFQDRFRVLVFDARGSGQSDLEGPFTRQRWVDDVEQVRQWAGAEKFVLGGGSYGGVVALEYALSHGNRLHGLIVRDTFADGQLMLKNIMDLTLSSDTITVDKERQKRLWTGTTFDNEDYGAGLSEISPLFVKPAGPGEIRKEVKVQGPSAAPRLHHATHNEAFGKDLLSYNVTESLSKINVPMLVVTGSHDRICLPAQSELMQQKIPNASLVTFEGSGHSPPEDQPEEWKAAVSRFLDSIAYT